jgi:SAM-dependent methyltransferase
MSYLYIPGQQRMALDDRRNEAYAQALAQVITPESVVLDLGSGLGILGLMAAQLGAKRVYLVEPENIIAVTQEIVRVNGLSDRVRCLHGEIEKVEIPEKVDVITSVFTGNFLLTEDLLPSLFYARDKYLKPGGVLIPNAAFMEAVPVSVPKLYADDIEVWSTPYRNLDHSPARTYASQSLFYYREALSESQYLAEPANLKAMDFYSSTGIDCKTEVNYTVRESGLCHGWAGWFQMQLGDRWLSTAPHEPLLHWSWVFLPLDPPISLTAGETVTFQLQRPPKGDWTWKVKSASTQQRHSSFFSMPMTAKSLHKIAATYKPQISPKGKVIHYILSNFDGSQSIHSLSEQVVDQFPDQFPNFEQAFCFVQGVTANCG